MWRLAFLSFGAGGVVSLRSRPLFVPSITAPSRPSGCSGSFDLPVFSRPHSPLSPHANDEINASIMAMLAWLDRARHWWGLRQTYEAPYTRSIDQGASTKNLYTSWAVATAGSWLWTGRLNYFPILTRFIWRDRAFSWSEIYFSFWGIPTPGHTLLRRYLARYQNSLTTHSHPYS